MSGFCKCLLYLVAIGAGLFLAGRLLPKRFPYLRFPYMPFAFEKNGEFYNRIRIRKWQNKLPDMSRLCPDLMPAKKLPKRLNSANIELMLQETCMAELTHFILCFLGLGCTFLWKGFGGKLLTALYFLGNLPFILIQRYNRPRLVRLLERQLLKESAYEKCAKEIKINEEGTYIKLQYRAGA